MGSNQNTTKAYLSYNFFPTQFIVSQYFTASHRFTQNPLCFWHAN
jgi:hypothetical protein